MKILNKLFNLDARCLILDARKTTNEYLASSIEDPLGGNEVAQSIVEYCVMFAVIVGVLILAIINGPVGRGLNTTIGNAIDVVNDSIQGLIQ